MMDIKDRLPSLSHRPTLGVGAVLLLALGAAGGAGAVSLTRPAIEMAPLDATPVNRLDSSSGIVTVKGKVAEIFGDRVVVQDQTGRAMVNVGRRSGVSLSVGQAVTVQGRYDDGVLRASYLIGADGRVRAIGPAGLAPHEAEAPGHPRPDGPPAPGAPGGAGIALPADCSAPPPPPAPTSPGVASGPQGGTTAK